MFHKDLVDGDIHYFYTWEYVDSAARLAATGFIASDVGKLALQKDNMSVWMLIDESPITWQSFGQSGTTDHSLLSNRGIADQHPISAITGLQTRIDNKVHVATADPTVDDDVTLGFAINDFWINKTTRKLFVATDVTDGAAVWAKASYDITTTVATPGVDTLVPTEKATRDALNTKADLISANTSYYISPTGNDVTGDGTSGNPWATPNKALDYLKNKVIAADAMVTIECADGAYSLGTAIVVNHPCGNRITIKGTNTYSKTINSIASSSGAAGNWSYVLNMNNVTNVAIGDVMLIRNPSGAYAPSSMNKLVGACAITNVGASTITITHYGRYAAAATNAAVGLEAIILKARFNFTVSDGLTVKTALNLSRLHFTATGGYCVIADGGVIRVPTGEPLTCIGTAAGGIFAKNNALFDGSNYIGIGGTNILGVSCWDSVINIGNYACGGCAIGAVASLNGVINCGTCHLAGCLTGLQAAANSVMNAGVSMLTDNTNNAAFCDSRSYMSLNSSSIWNNNIGIYAQYGAWVYANGISYSGNGTNTTPALNTIGNNQAFITT